MPHSGGAGGWGSSGWGYASWGGGGGGGALVFLGVAANRENVFRFEFSVPVYFSGILDPKDAAHPSKWSISPVAGTVGLDGNPVRPLLVSEVFIPGPADGVETEDLGRFVDVVCDRAMTPFPALYDVAATDIWARDLLTNIAMVEVQVPAVFKRIEPPQIATPSLTRDFANSQTLTGARSSLPDPTNPLVLGTIQVDDTGDYAFDEGIVNLRKRVIRRLVTKKNAFAHLPGYGVGIPEQGKRLAISSVVQDLAAEAEAQIALEPDVSKVKVRPIVDPNTPGLVRFQVFVRPRSGPPQRFDVPFSST